MAHPRRTLKHARSRGDYVSVKRSGKGRDAIPGYVVGLGRRWVLLACEREGDPDGYTVLRLKAIRAVRRRSDTFVRRSWKLHDAWPPQPPPGGVDLDHGVARLISSLADHRPTLTLFAWADDGGCLIGRPRNVRRRQVDLQEITPQGRWEDSLTQVDTSLVTRLEFDGIYERNLIEVAGKRPQLRR